MKNYSELSDFEINKLVAIALDIDMHFFMPESEDSFHIGFLPTELGPVWQTSAGFIGEFTASNGNMFNPCNNPSDAWPIIVENKISTQAMDDDARGLWYSESRSPDNYYNYHCFSDKPLRAAMIAYLMMKEGENA